MSELSLQKDDVGIRFIIVITPECGSTTGMDISDCSDFNIIFKRPDGYKYTVDASFLTDGTDGKIQYISGSEDLTVAGRWKIQVSYVKSGNIKYTQIDTFLVTKNL